MRDNTHIVQKRFTVEEFNFDLDLNGGCEEPIEIVGLAEPAFE